MSRRYGRNQKRAARERIAQLESTCAESNEACLNLLRQFGSATEQLKRVTDALGPNFIGLDPVGMAEAAVDPWREKHFRMMAPYRDSPSTMNFLLMESQDASVSESPAVQMHVCFELSDHRVAYAISTEAIRFTPAHVLAEQIARQIATRLVSVLRQNGAKK